MDRGLPTRLSSAAGPAHSKIDQNVSVTSVTRFRPSCRTAAEACHCLLGTTSREEVRVQGAAVWGRVSGGTTPRGVTRTRSTRTPPAAAWSSRTAFYWHVPRAGRRPRHRGHPMRRGKPVPAGREHLCLVLDRTLVGPRRHRRRWSLARSVRARRLRHHRHLGVLVLDRRRRCGFLSGLRRGSQVGRLPRPRSPTPGSPPARHTATPWPPWTTQGPWARPPRRRRRPRPVPPISATPKTTTTRSPPDAPTGASARHRSSPSCARTATCGTSRRRRARSGTSRAATFPRSPSRAGFDS